MKVVHVPVAKAPGHCVLICVPLKTAPNSHAFSAACRSECLSGTCPGKGSVSLAAYLAAACERARSRLCAPPAGQKKHRVSGFAVNAGSHLCVAVTTDKSAARARAVVGTVLKELGSVSAGAYSGMLAATGVRGLRDDFGGCAKVLAEGLKSVRVVVCGNSKAAQAKKLKDAADAGAAKMKIPAGSGSCSSGGGGGEDAHASLKASGVGLYLTREALSAAGVPAHICGECVQVPKSLEGRAQRVVAAAKSALKDKFRKPEDIEVAYYAACAAACHVPDSVPSVSAALSAMA